MGESIEGDEEEVIYRITAKIDGRQKTFLSMTDDKEKVKANFPFTRKVEILKVVEV